jgi:hypothetical protein
MELIEDSADTPEEVVLNRDRSAQLAHLPRTDFARPSRNPRPRLLPGKVRRGGRRGHPHTEEHGEDSHVLRSQTVSAAIGGPSGLRSPHGLPGGLIRGPRTKGCCGRGAVARNGSRHPRLDRQAGLEECASY